MEERKNIENLENLESTSGVEEESLFDFRTIIAIFILNWQWFILSVFIFLCGSLIYLRYKSPIFQVSAKMLIKDDSNNMQNGNRQMLSNMQDFGFISNSNGVDNEIEILQSRILVKEAVKDLKLYTEYKIEGKIKDNLIYKTQPINVDLDPQSLNDMDKSFRPITMKITKKGNSFEVTGKAYDNEGNEKPFQTKITSFPASKRTAGGVLTFTANGHYFSHMSDRKEIYVTILPPNNVAAQYVGAMSVEPTSKTTSIARITVRNKSKERAEDFLKQMAICYNRQANADKNEVAYKTEEFINERLEKINAELGSTEGELEQYKKRNNLIQLKLDASEALSQTSQFSTKLSDAKTQIQLLDYLRQYVDNPANKYQIIPSNVGLADGASIQLITQYNQNVLARNRLLRSASEIAPRVMEVTSTLDALQSSIRTALAQARRSADITRQGIEDQYASYQTKISHTPEQERILTQIGRQQEVKSGLYLMLLQKREENSISLAATADKGKLIDDPIFEGKVSPKNSMITMMALAIGFLLPLVIIYLLQMFRYKIEGHMDVARLTNLPIIADVAITSENVKSDAGIVVHENKNDMVDEIYRGMRTNIQFMLKEDEKVIMFTSSTSGEGKTFNASNLAVSFALLGKKVILMGLDIRKPALGRLFNISDKTAGITNLLKKNNITKDDITSQITQSKVNNNLDLMMAGPIPPNPTELLARENLSVVLEELKNRYDYIIIDTAPIGLVTDTLQINKHADIAVVICRADYTPKAAFGMINSLAADNKLTNACIVINGVDMSKKKYGYYYGYGKYGKYGRYSRYGYSSYKRYGAYGYGGYGTYGTYGNYANSHYGQPNDNSIKK
ncbi:GumC family protein [Xylanibacter muris]|uniref:non-specific protein-tyrosine kinase n=1 Tax=Xylanibacter muris TaxID=2736290 RepID=A0ABX2AN39_9BACT|nr:tyrosine-protein kinase [Xylanibacter muris]NPD92631.1 polysaccharide biosynthesis tyrosine autokinase [Xylanibacter muris]